MPASKTSVSRAGSASGATGRASGGGPRRPTALGLRAAPFLALLLIAGPWTACRTPEPPKHNVVVVLIDTLRRDSLGCYGNPHRPSPHIDALAAEGVRFDQAISTSGWTLPAVGSLLTGTWPTIHGGVGKNVTLSPIRDEVPTAAEVLRAAGFNTIAFANAAFVSPLLHLDRGFDVFDHRYAFNWDVRRADETIEGALELIRRHGEESNFVLIHLFDPHLDYDPPGEYASRFTGGRDKPAPPLKMETCLAMKSGAGGPPAGDDIDYIAGVYLGEAGFVDAQVGRLVAGLKEIGIYDRTALVVTSDHGEEFWEHDGFEHGHTLYDELIRIPLIIKPPATISPALKVVDAQVRVVDIMPTIFGIVGVEQPGSFVGDSLMPLMMGEEATDRVAFSEATLYGSDKLSWRTSKYKLIYDTDPASRRPAEVYDWRNDPGEQNDLADSHPEIARELYQELQSFVEQLAIQAASMSELEPTPMGPRHIEQLRSLGYIR